MINRSDRQRLLKIKQYCDILLDISINKGYTPETMRLHMEDNVLFQFEVSMPLVQIGELASHISADITSKYTSVPWRIISGLRNKLVHDYEDTNWEIINDILFNDLIPLKNCCEQILIQENTL